MTDHYLMLVPFMPPDMFVAALPDGLPEGWEVKKESVWLTIRVPTEADAIMAKLVMPTGWGVAGVYAVDDQNVRRIDSTSREDVKTVVGTNEKLAKTV